MKSLTVDTKKFTQDELVMMIEFFQTEKEDVKETSELFDEFIADPANPKWMTGKFINLPQELMGIVVMLKQLAPKQYENSVQEFTAPHKAETLKEVENISRIIVKLQMRQR